MLVLHSYDPSEDEMTQHRIERLALLQSAKNYEFGHTFVCSLEEGREESFRNPEKILLRIATEVERFRPDILLVHTGGAFVRFREVVAGTLRGLKSRFPSLEIGLQFSAFAPFILEGTDLGDVVSDSEEIGEVSKDVFGY